MNEIIYKAVEEDRWRRLKRRRLQQELADNDGRNMQVYLIITLPFGSIDKKNCVLSETLFTIELQENKHLGAKTWLEI